MSRQDAEQVKESVERWNALLAEDDLDGLRALVAEQYDPEVLIDWSATNPSAGSGRGIEAVLDWVAANRESMQVLRFELLNAIQVSDALAIHMRAPRRSAGMGFSMEYAYVNRYNEGQINYSTTH